MVENKPAEKEHDEMETKTDSEIEHTEDKQDHGKEDNDLSGENEETNDVLQEKQAEIEQLQQEKDDHYDRMLRVQAEFDNFKRRTQKEKAAERKYKSQDLANELLPVLDNFERALQVESNDETSSIIEGITMVYRQLLDTLKSHDIEAIDTVGKPFDPNLHHAVMQVEDEEFESNVIVEELQKGYMLKDRVLRPSMVKVNK